MRERWTIQEYFEEVIKHGCWVVLFPMFIILFLIGLPWFVIRTYFMKEKS